MKKYKVLVCGTTFGQVYLSSFMTRNTDFRLAGIMGKGSSRSKQYAKEFGVPLYSNADEIPADIDIACVVVRSTIAGGEGTLIVKQLLKRGINVIQEHPVHAGDIASCLELASSNKVFYHVNSHYVHVEPVTIFIEYLGKAVQIRKPIFIEPTASLQTLYSLIDIIGRALDGFRPFALGGPLVWDNSMLEASQYDYVPFICLQGAIKGIPFTLKVQNYYDPDDFDNHFLIMHRVSVGNESGNLTLVNSHGPVIWSQGFSISGDTASENSFCKRKTAFSDYKLSTALSFTPAKAPSLSEIATRIWPCAIQIALQQMREHVETGMPAPGQSAEYLLDLSTLWLDITKRMGALRTMKIDKAPMPFPDPLLYFKKLDLKND